MKNKTKKTNTKKNQTYGPEKKTDGKLQEKICELKLYANCTFRNLTIDSFSCVFVNCVFENCQFRDINTSKFIVCMFKNSVFNQRVDCTTFSQCQNLVFESNRVEHCFIKLTEGLTANNSCLICCVVMNCTKIQMEKTELRYSSVSSHTYMEFSEMKMRKSDIYAL